MPKLHRGTDFILLGRVLECSFPVLILKVTKVFGRATSGVLFPFLFRSGSCTTARLKVCKTYFGITIIVIVFVRTFQCTCRPFVFTGGGSSSGAGTCSRTVGCFVVFSLVVFLNIVCCLSVLGCFISTGCCPKLHIIPVIVLNRLFFKVCFGLSF